MNSSGTFTTTFYWRSSILQGHLGSKLTSGVLRVACWKAQRFYKGGPKTVISVGWINSTAISEVKKNPVFSIFFVPFIGVGSLFITRGPSCKAVLLPQNFPSPTIKEAVYIALVETWKNEKRWADSFREGILWQVFVFAVCDDLYVLTCHCKQS